MLRGIGIAIIIFGALGVLAALQSLTSVFLGRWSDYGLGASIYSGAFAASGMAVGMLLLRRQSIKRHALFWMGLLGACLCAPLAVLHVLRCIFWAKQNEDPLGFFALVILGNVGSDAWWGPREVLFLNTLMHANHPFAEAFLWYGKPFHEPYLWTCRVAFSASLWIHFPLALCLWSIWGRAGALIGKFFAWGALLLAALLVTTVAEVAWTYYQQSTFNPGPGTVVDYIYIPRLSWFVFYAIAVLWLIAFAALVFRKSAESEKPVAA